MNFPIIEFRDQNLFVLNSFEGKITKSTALRPFNFQRNLTRYVLDSDGTIWTFKHCGHDNNGLKKIISYFKNVSTDTYAIEETRTQNLKWLKDLLLEYVGSNDPDVEEMARSIIEDVSHFHDAELLAVAMKKLKL